MVGLVFWSNFLKTYWYSMEVLPTPGSPTMQSFIMMSCSILSDYGGGREISTYKSGEGRENIMWVGDGKILLGIEFFMGIINLEAIGNVEPLVI